jgi:hypothetical protein
VKQKCDFEINTKANNRSKGENSPNLVTLVSGQKTASV